MGDRIEQGTEKAHPMVAAVEDYLHGAGITPETLRYAATHEALCRSWIFDLLTGLADTMEASESRTPPEPKARSLTVWCSSCLPGRPCFVHEEDGGYPPPSDNPSSPGDEWGDADRPLTDVKVRPVMDEEWQESHDLDPSGFDTSPAAGEG